MKRDFAADDVNELWLTDITEHSTEEEKLYLCAIKDVFSGRIVGYSMDSRMKARLAVNALVSAVTRRGEVAGCIVHSDRGSQGGFNWLSQHPDREGVWWDEIQRNQRCRRVRVDSGKRIGRSDRSCGRRGIRSTAGMSSQRSGIR